MVTSLLVQSREQPDDTCLDDNALLAIVEGRGQTVLVRRRAHLDRCAPCRSVVAELAGIAEVPTVTTAKSDLLGRFTLKSTLAPATWRALDEESGRDVVVRMVSATARDVLERLAGTEHPHVCSAAGWWLHSDEHFVVARDYVTGTALSTLLDRESFAETRALELLFGVADALLALHRAGTPHGHLVPNNVFVDLGGHVLVTDAGCSVEPASVDADLAALSLLTREVTALVRGSASELARVLAPLAAPGLGALERFVQTLRARRERHTPKRGSLAPGSNNAPLTGAVLQDRFEVEDIVAQGGMGAVYRGVDRTSGAPVAIKLMLPSLHGQERFEREARALTELDSPAIVRYVAHGEISGRHYLVMEWIEGEPLSVRLRRGPLDPDLAVKIVTQAADGLALAHARGIVHRDLKPENLMLRRGDALRVAVVDFGLTHQAGVDRTLTVDGAILGTPGFMAPEQARGDRRVDARADVFALGCILYRCVSGRRPFEGSDMMAVLAKTALSPAAPLRELCPGIPEQLTSVVERAMAKDPAERYGDAGELAAALRQLAASLFASGATTVVSAPWVGRDESESATVLAVRAPVPHDVVRAEAERYGGRFVSLADGGALVLWGGSSAIDERLARSAECALSLARGAPGAAIALATGLLDRDASVAPVGEVIERVAHLALCARVPRGAILLDDATFGLLSGRYTLAEDGETRCLLGRQAEPRPRNVLGRPTPFVGRAVELSTIGALLDECVEGATARVVLVTGAPGIGKSRLAYEALHAASKSHPRARVLSARAELSSDGSPFGLAAGLLRSLCGASEADDVARQRALLGAALGRLGLAPDDLLHPLESLMGIHRGARDEPEEPREDALMLKDRIQTAWLELFSALCSRSPCILLLEDLQWGDFASLSALDATLGRLHTHSFAVLAVARSEVDSRFPGLWSARSVTRVRLGPLRGRAAEALVREVLGADATDERIAAVLKPAEGNPFHIEELLRASGSGNTTIPGSVLALARARIDALDAPTRRVLQAASIFGRCFWQGGVRALMAIDTGDLRTTIEELIRREVLERAASSRLGHEPELEFRHGLLRDAVYSMLSPHERALGHLRAGDWLEQTGLKDPVVLADHFDAGGARERAAEQLLAAAERALTGSDLRAVERYAGRALACAPARNVPRLFLLTAEAEIGQGHPAAAADAARSAMDRLPAGSRDWCEAAVVLAEALQTVGDRAALGQLAQQLTSAASSLEDRAAYAVACARVVIDLRRSDVVQARDALLEAVSAHAAAIDERDTRRRAFIHRHRALEAFISGDWDQELTELRESVRLFDSAGDFRWAARQRFNLGYFLTLFGLAEEGESELRRALDVVQRLGLSELEQMMQQNLGFALLRLGRRAEAEECYAKSLAALGENGAQRKQGISHLYLAQIALERGEHARAELAARQSVECFEAGAPHLVPFARAVTARALMELGQTEPALLEADAAYAHLSEKTGVAEGEFYVRWTKADLVSRSGDRAEALRIVDLAAARLRELAARIRSPELRTSFLERVPVHALVFSLREQWHADGHGESESRIKSSR